MASCILKMKGVIMKKYMSIKESLKIMMQDLMPGNPIPSERELAKQFMTTRTTIRQAITQLEKEGLVIRTVGRKGTLVAPPQIQVPHNQILGFKEQIKQMGMIPSYRLLKKEIQMADSQVASQLGINVGDNVILVERVCLVNEMPVSIEETYMPYDMFPDLLSEEPFPSSLYTYIQGYLGSKIKFSTQMISAVTAPKKYVEALAISRHEALIYIENCAKLQDGSIFEFSRTYQVGSRYKLYLSISQ